MKKMLVANLNAWLFLRLMVHLKQLIVKVSYLSGDVPRRIIAFLSIWAEIVSPDYFCVDWYKRVIIMLSSAIFFIQKSPTKTRDNYKIKKMSRTALRNTVIWVTVIWVIIMIPCWLLFCNFNNATRSGIFLPSVMESGRIIATGHPSIFESDHFKKIRL